MHVLDMILKVIEMQKKKRYVPIRTHPSACKALARCSSLISAWQGNNGGVILVQNVFMSSHLLRQVFKLLF